MSLQASLNITRMVRRGMALGNRTPIAEQFCTDAERSATLQCNTM